MTIRIHFTYRHVEKPWGGANNFIRALRSRLDADPNFVFTETVTAPADLIFMNQLGAGPAGQQKKYSLKEVKALLAGDRRKLVVRVVNLHRHAFRMGLRNMLFGTLADRGTIGLCKLAHMIVFQSAYQ